MKRLHTLIAFSCMSTALWAQNEVSCPLTVLSGTISANRTLDADTMYLLRNCVSVSSGVTITAQAGVIIMGEKETNGGIVFRKGSYLISQGTSSQPVVWTSDQTAGNKAPGDWSGIAFEGDATNNQSNSITLSNRTCSITGGGTDDADSSGVLKFMRIEFPVNGLSLVSLGNKTVLEDIQVAYPSENAYEFYGGTVRAKRLIALNAKAADVIAKFGNRSLIQYLIAVRLDASAHISSGDFSNSIVMGNNDNAGASYAGTPANHTVISNASLIGPLYCGASGLSSDFKNGVLYYHNTDGGVYNSVVAGWPTGLRMEDASTLDNADVNYTLNFFENSFYNNTTQYSNSGSWPGSCAIDMQDWIEGSAFGSCAQSGNQFQSPSYTLGYSSTVCSTYSSTTPSFLLGTTDLEDASYPSSTDLDNAFFTSSSQKHGALNSSTDWTTSWASWYPQGTEYCPEEMMRTTGIKSFEKNGGGIAIVPNPASGDVFVEYNATEAGTANITIINSVGQVVRTIEHSSAEGNQRVRFTTDGLSSGIYILNLTAGSQNLRSRFVVK